MSDDITALSLIDVAKLIRRRAISAVEATRACLDSIERWQPRINAFIAVEADAALKAARRLDARMKSGGPVGPLHGVPLAHKDMFYRKGAVCSAGSKIRRNWKAPYDSTAMTRLAAAGAICLGRLNMSEFAAHPTGHNDHCGACLNPWDPKHITGGSSSGSGAATAARLVFGALGSDTGGSIRIPAALNGVCGLMPTYGRVSRHGAVPRSWSLDHVGPLARTAADCAIMLSASAGHDPQDGASAMEPSRRFEAGLDGGIKGLRVGVPALPATPPVEAGVRCALSHSLDVLKSLGARAVPVRLPDLSELFDLCELIVRSEAATMHGNWLRQRPRDYSDYFRARIEGGLYIPATWYLQALSRRGPLLQAFLEKVMSRCDVLLMPVTPRTAPLVADMAKPVRGVSALTGLATYTRPFNYLGLPAMSVPCGFDKSGLPLAFQLAARPFDEQALLRTAHAYQSATDWHRRQPMLRP